MLPILPISIDAFDGAGGASRFGLFLADTGADDPVQRIHLAQVRHAVVQALLALDERERLVICSRFGFFDGEKQTLEEIGQGLRLSRERIRQIEFKAKEKLRAMRNLIELRGRPGQRGSFPSSRT